MLSKEQREKVMKLFSDGVGVSEIGKKVGVSRQSVYRVIQNGFEEDTEIYALKKEIRRAELNEKLREIKKPSETVNEVNAMKKAIAGLKEKIEGLEDLIAGLNSRVLALWYVNPDVGERVGKRPPACLYCGEGLVFVTRKVEGGNEFGYRCAKCRAVFFFPPYPRY